MVGDNNSQGNVLVTLARSPIGSKPKTVGTLRALGLRKIGDSRVHEIGPVLAGMIRRVEHLVRVESFPVVRRLDPPLSEDEGIDPGDYRIEIGRVERPAMPTSKPDLHIAAFSLGETTQSDPIYVVGSIRSTPYGRFRIERESYTGRVTLAWLSSASPGALFRRIHSFGRPSDSMVVIKRDGSLREIAWVSALPEPLLRSKQATVLVRLQANREALVWTKGHPGRPAELAVLIEAGADARLLEAVDEIAPVQLSTTMIREARELLEGKR